MSKFDVARFLIFGLIFVSGDWSWHKRQLWRVDRQSLYGANFFKFCPQYQISYTDWYRSVL